MSNYETELAELLELAARADDAIASIRERVTGMPFFQMTGHFNTRDPYKAAEACIIPIKTLVGTLTDNQKFIRAVGKYDNV